MSGVPMRVGVTRGDRYDVVEWEPGQSEWFGSGTEPPRQSSGGVALFAVVAALLIVAGTFFLVRSQRPKELGKPLVATVGDLSAVHAKVTAGGEEVRRLRRVSSGEVVETDVDGRARLRLDDGTALVLDRDTKVVLSEKGLAVERGRIFVQGALGARSEIDLGSATAIVSGATAAIERPKDDPSKAKVYVVTDELTVRAGTAEQTVRAGDTASVVGGKVTVAPERGFDDWTGGMAAPWGANGAPRRAVGELWGRSAANPAGGAGSPLTIRAHDVRASVAREVATTEVRSTFFNAGGETVLGDFRMALPPGAIVTRFATIRGEAVTEGRVALAARKQSAPTASGEVLEWAGEGWVRATIPAITSGAAVTVLVEYVEWLSPRPRDGGGLVVQYRYPMVGSGQAPLVGEFSARVDAAPSNPVSIASGLGARVSGQAIEIRKPDFRPTADLVVDVEIERFKKTARLYVAPQLAQNDEGGTVIVRTEAPVAEAGEGVALSLVLDASGSIEPALLDAEKALVEAVLQGLGPRDRIAVLAVDQTARPVGPEAIGPADPARKKAILDALANVSPGGATDLGRALEAGADVLPADAPAAMVIYIGDGWPTVGDANVDAILARLARRPNGTPRLGAVAVGPLVNRFALASLVRGSGPLLEIADSNDAARTAIALLSDALQPTVADVSIAFGPEVERIYPRAPRASIAGETVTFVGRVRGEPPKEITLKWRDAKGAHAERRALVLEETARPFDVYRRWAMARVDEIALSGKGREAATDVALRAGLLSPWTGWLTGGGDTYVPTTLGTRVLDLAIGPDAGFAAAIATPVGGRGTLSTASFEDDSGEGDDREDAFKQAVSRAARRLVDDAGDAVRECRDSRASLRPDLSGSLGVAFELDGDGHASQVKVRGDGSADDAALDRCVEVVIEGLNFPESGLKVKIKVVERVALPRSRASLRARTCSPTAALPTALRRGVWLERLNRSPGPGPSANVYLEAKDGCELATWTDRRALLELMLGMSPDLGYRIGVARELEAAGESDAGTLVRRETVRRARSPEELAQVQRMMLGDESYPRGVFKKQYAAAKNDEGRLAVVRRFLAIAPHDARLHRRLFALLEALDQKQPLAEEVRRLRRDPFADAGLLADGASALRRMGDEVEARRAFGELAERAPDDAWARAFLGDRLRNEGWFDDATRAYTVLEDLLPDDPAALLRLSLAHAGAKRIDIAGRMLARVAQTGGRTANAELGDLSSRLALDLFAEARTEKGVSAEDADRLGRASLELPDVAGSTVFLIRAPAGGLRIESILVRGAKGAREERQPDASAPAIGLYSHRVDPGDDGDVVLQLRRRAEPEPAHGTKVQVDALVTDGPQKPRRRITTELVLPASGKTIELHFSNGSFSSG